MKVVQINSTCDVGSTGKICVSLSRLLTQREIENHILYTHGHSSHPLGIRYSGTGYRKLQALKSRILGNGGFNAHLATLRLLGNLERLRPDIVHLHNIHGHDCDLGLLFRYLKRKNIRLFWTFHDCWPFTANCPYFTLADCQQWKTGCCRCPQIRQTSWFFDRSKTLYRRKQQLFSGLDLQIITPSRWMAELVQESFLNAYPVRVIPNGVDLPPFRPTPSHFRQRYGLEGRFLLLGVAFNWDKRKGLDVFVELARRLDDHFQILLVGTDPQVDRLLPDRILSIHRTQNQRELAEIYTAADLFVNPTREDNFPTVNLEALACGTPVITFTTGGSPESIDETCGLAVPREDVEGLIRGILQLCREPISEDACLRRARLFDAAAACAQYVDFYEQQKDPS